MEKTNDRDVVLVSLNPKEHDKNEEIKNKKRKSIVVGVKYHEVINMTKHKKRFEERLNSLILLKALLMKENGFDQVTQQEYEKAWEEMFDLLK